MFAFCLWSCWWRCIFIWWPGCKAGNEEWSWCRQWHQTLHNNDRSVPKSCLSVWMIQLTWWKQWWQNFVVLCWQRDTSPSRLSWKDSRCLSTSMVVCHWYYDRRKRGFLRRKTLKIFICCRSSAGRKSCPLCPEEKFKACYSHKLRRHLQNLHWKVYVEFEGRKMLRAASTWMQNKYCH